MTTSAKSRLEHTIGAEGLLAIHLRHGEINVRGVDGDAVRIRNVNGDDLTEMFRVEAADGSLSIRAARGLELVIGSRAFRREYARESARLEVEVPRRATVVIETQNGEIEARDLAGDQRYHTASGEVDLRSVSGTISVEVVSGDLEIVSVDNATLAIRSVSGDVEVKAGTLKAFEAQTTSGDVKLAGRLSGSGPFAIETVSGDALVALAGAVRVEMTTVTGDLTSDVEGAQVTEQGRRAITIGSGGPTLTVRSMSGDVHIGRAVAIDRPAAAFAPQAPIEPPVPVAPVPPQAPGTAPAANGAILAAYEEARLRILRSLERGEIDVSEAGRRLETLDAGDPDATPARTDG